MMSAAASDVSGGEESPRIPSMLTLRGSPVEVHSLTFSPDGQWLAVPDRNGLQLWHPVTAGGSPRALLAVWIVGDVLFSPDGRKLLLGIRGALRTRDLETGEHTDLPL